MALFCCRIIYKVEFIKMKQAPIIIGEDVQNDAEVRTIFHSSSRLPVLSALKLVIAILIIYLTVYFVWIEALSLDYFPIKMVRLYFPIQLLIFISNYLIKLFERR